MAPMVGRVLRVLVALICTLVAAAGMCGTVFLTIRLRSYFIRQYGPAPLWGEVLALGFWTALPWFLTYLFAYNAWRAWRWVISADRVESPSVTSHSSPADWGSGPEISDALSTVTMHGRTYDVRGGYSSFIETNEGRAYIRTDMGGRYLEHPDGSKTRLSDSTSDWVD